MILRAVLVSAVALSLAAPALAQDHEVSGLQCAAVNALGADGAVAFFYGYEAGVIDFIRPEGHRAASAPVMPSSGIPDSARRMAEACAASPGASLAQILATENGTEDPIDLRNHLMQP